MIRVLLVLRLLFGVGLGQQRVARVYNSMASMANWLLFGPCAGFFLLIKMCDDAVLGLV
jgi:hypothetical protein